MKFSISEVAKKMNLSVSTIRYYDKEGLLPFIERTDSGYRIFSESDVKMLEIIECLKHTGMSIKDIKAFSNWVKDGDYSLEQRYEMFLERKKIVEEQIQELQKSLDLINHKCWYYKTALEAGTENIHKNKSCHDY
ncbi:MerR family transcriptional regulator [Clostridium baratii]|uniref:MerR family transcriptional regulator n=1 Tax=Clostridium baratii TaxID=1561 RepID=A0A174RWY0_9CLOT|nr:MerR family transcriptional regulator [Clostridium baratii]OPF52345.1 MerR family transcriptional regulator [Clostridium baratii]OPF55795.1 MerR family transcriptional regulator [Clostridium baratii]OPF56825.1 MerR family transcriptional regulator [Clostridium baratii]OPF59824.1 MerR family transcriptional regulator [Clostridium baratii]CUP87828.1 MerR family transcriptional regulator [Clostridium baratii]